MGYFVEERGRLPFQSDAILETGRITLAGGTAREKLTEHGRTLKDVIDEEMTGTDDSSGTDNLYFGPSDSAVGVDGLAGRDIGISDPSIGVDDYTFPVKANTPSDAASGTGWIGFKMGDTAVGDETISQVKEIISRDTATGTDSATPDVGWKLGILTLSPPPDTFNYSRGELVGIKEQAVDIEDEEQFLGRQITTIVLEGWMLESAEYDGITSNLTLQEQVDRMNTMLTGGERVTFQRPGWSGPIKVAIKEFEIDKNKGDIDSLRYKIVLVNEGYDE